MTVGVPEINNSSWRIKYVKKKEEEEPEPKMTAPIKAGAPKGGGTGAIVNSGLSTKQPKDLGITDSEPDGEGGRIKLPPLVAARNLKERLQRVRVGQPLGGLPKKQKPKKVKERNPPKDITTMTDEEHEEHINSGKWHKEQKKLTEMKQGFRKQRRARNEVKPTEEQKEESSKFQNQKPIEQRLNENDKEKLSDLHGKKGGLSKPQPKKEELSKPTTDKIELADLNVDISDYQNQDNKSLHRRLVEAGYENESTDKKAYKNRKLADMLKRGETKVKIKRPPQKKGTKQYYNAPEDKDSLASDSEMEEKRQVERLGGKTRTEHKDVETKHKVPPSKRTGESQSDKDNERSGDASEQEVKEDNEGTEDDKEATRYDSATDEERESDKEDAKLNVAGKHKKTRIRRQRKLGEPPEDVKPETVSDDRKDQKTYRGHTLQSDTLGGKYTSGEGSEKEFHDRDGEGQEQDKAKKELARKRKLEAQERKDEDKPTKEMEKLQTKLHNSRVRAYVTTLTANQAGRFKKLSPEEQKRKMDEADKKKNKSVESWNNLSSKIQNMNGNVKQQNISNTLGKLTNTVGNYANEVKGLNNRTQDKIHSSNVQQNIKDKETV